MQWNLRLTAAHRGIWTASDLQRRLAAHGLVISAGKMSGLWSGTPHSIKLSDLDVLCAVLQASPADLLAPDAVPAVQTDQPLSRTAEAAAPARPDAAFAPPADAASSGAVRPRRRGGRSLPPPV
jgi:DNA-binding Xre family transcriptional regulator